MKSEIMTAPHVIIDKTIQDNVHLDVAKAVEVMKTCGIPPEEIVNTVIYIDAKFHLNINGSVWPKQLARLRYGRSGFEVGVGNVVRMSSRVLGKPRPSESLNHTLVHEIEHVAQIERKDIRLLIGHLTMLLGTLAGMWLSMWASESLRLVFPLRILCVLVGAAIGLQIGYLFAWHEIQARRVAGKTITSSVKVI